MTSPPLTDPSRDEPGTVGPGRQSSRNSRDDDSDDECGDGDRACVHVHPSSPARVADPVSVAERAGARGPLPPVSGTEFLGQPRTASTVFFRALGCDGPASVPSSSPRASRHRSPGAPCGRGPRGPSGTTPAPPPRCGAHVLDEHGGLGVEALGVGLHAGQLDDQEVGDVVLLVGLQDVLLEVGQQLADAGVHHLVLDVGVHREQLDDLVDELALARRGRSRRRSRSPGRSCGSPCGPASARRWRRWT